jgi:hypothetical protein
MTLKLRAVARLSEWPAMILPYDITANAVWTDMQTASLLIDMIASGQKLMQLICSPSGFGKTAIAKKRFKHHGILAEDPAQRRQAVRDALAGTANPKKPKLFIEARPDRPISLVRVLLRCARLSAAVLLFDDPGKIAGDEASCDILKTTFGAQRTVAFETPEITRNEEWRISGHNGYDPFLPPPSFRIPASLGWLWLANTNFTNATVLAKLGNHFAPRLNPFWIRDDAEHDNYDLFLYVVYLATEQNLLRGMGFPYDVVRRAVSFYVTHVNRLIDLCPRRLELIARAFGGNLPPAALEAELVSMLDRTNQDIRPKLKLPATWVTVTDGVPSGGLIWPEQPFSKHKPVTENDPPRLIRKRERDWKRKHARPPSEPGLPPAASLPRPAQQTEEPPTAAQPAPKLSTEHPHARPPDFGVSSNVVGKDHPLTCATGAVASAPPASSPAIVDRDRVAMLLATPLSELARTLSAQDDTELSRLIGDPASILRQ